MQKKADSIVASHWGKTNFHKYIRLDSSISQYLVHGDFWDKQCSFNSKLTFEPNTCRYRYWVIHPAFRGDTAKIEFYLDKDGEFLFDDAEGLLSFGNLDKVKTLTKEQAIQKAIAYSQNNKKDFRGGVHGEWTVTLHWHQSVIIKGNFPYNEPFKGHFCWDVKADLDEPRREGCSAFNKRTFMIDIFNGELVMTSESND